MTELVGGDDPEFEVELITIFLTDAPSLVRAIQEAHATDDAVGVRRGVHTLKSQAAVFSAEPLLDACRRLEHASEAGLPDSTLVASVVANAADVVHSMSAFRD